MSHSIAPTPETLTCSECGETFDAGYLPALERDGEYAPEVDAAVCTACGFNEVGYAGCAPELGDLAAEADVLLHVGTGENGVEVRSVKE